MKNQTCSRVNDDILNDRAIQMLSGDEFRDRFIDALYGARNEFSEFIKPVGARLTGKPWLELRQVVFRRDDFTCRYCTQRGGRLECDHVIPISRGGTNHPDNLVTACFACNRSKHDKTPDEWLS